MEYTSDEAASARGAVLNGIPGHDAIVLRGRFASPATTVRLTFDYLYNGITNEYRSCDVTLNRTPNVGWRLMNRFNQVISHIAIRTRKIPLVGHFGISELQGACTAND